ncbi:hypothetical protein ASG37_12025 [Sphingomonas sp. Leaf407]|uniref:DUF1285 domain-containing protein n=1 Tax=unclassified Sphingomonas TaxID=196159 RepID=UPI0006FB1E6E|nr:MULTISPECIES: DUF1285 domain-containing protein [unclassified Sphingomonas]KQN37736.1 hypothetical protein ASE97_09315 [Sphingomonas sp. Leaf42]KQT28103.1 hypothetical protein ASG37_12025 [Sphingomonas sp. Leaf407]
MPMQPPADFASLSLAEVARLAADAKLPPVDRWNPTHCGDSEMRIAADGSWHHQGSPITRAEMVRLFATILRRESDGSHVLVTPVEKLSIAVEDAAFIAVEAKFSGEGEGQRIAFRLNTDEPVVADAAHAIRIEGSADAPRPYLHVRGGLDALIARPVFYELVERLVVGPDGASGLWSEGTFFPFEAA